MSTDFTKRSQKYGKDKSPLNSRPKNTLRSKLSPSSCTMPSPALHAKRAIQSRAMRGKKVRTCA